MSMKELFDKVSQSCSKAITVQYSTSFSLGIRFLSPSLHQPIYSIYAFVRLADEIVDSFQGYPQAQLLARFKADLEDALLHKISLNPILNDFQYTVYKYNIGLDLISTFLRSMEMDLNPVRYDEELYSDYILGSAEVVGLMCLCVFTGGKLDKYNELKNAAMKLGAAFQKVNFLRDLKDDYLILGRTYFPKVNFENFSNEDKKAIENEIDFDFKQAIEGIRNLPLSSRSGVYLAYIYYLKLFEKIKSKSAEQLIGGRIRISNTRKVGLMINSLLRTRMNLYH